MFRQILSASIFAILLMNIHNNAISSEESDLYHSCIKLNIKKSVEKSFYAETKSNYDLSIFYKSKSKSTISINIDNKFKIENIQLESTNGKMKRISLIDNEMIELARGNHIVKITLTDGNKISIFNIDFSPYSGLPKSQLEDPESDINDSFLFEDSCVTDFTSWNIKEENQKIPYYILPAYTGSGLLGVGIDGSGMQMLDSPLGRSNRYHQGKESHTDDIYVFGEGLVSDHIEPKNLMPLGYFTFNLSIDSNKIKSPENLILRSSDWQRNVDIRKALIETSYAIDEKIKVKISVFTPIGTNNVRWNVEFVCVDGKEHNVVFSPEINLKVRKERIGKFSGKNIYDSINIHNRTSKFAYLEGSVSQSGTFAPLNDYKIGYLISSDSKPDYFAYSDRIGFMNNFILKDKYDIGFQTTIIKLDIGEDEPDRDGFIKRSAAFIAGLNDLRQEAKQLDNDSFSSLLKTKFNQDLKTHEEDWNSYYSSIGEININNTKRELIFNNSQYLFRVAGTYNNGLPICFLLHHPIWWHAATFWDLNFVADGLIKTNNLDPVYKAISWLNKVKQPVGRAYPWVMFYNGKSAMQSDWNDTGYHVNAAHAMSAIRLYETTKDIDLLKDICYPIIRTVAEYSAENRFITDGKYYIGAGASGDINGPELLNDTFAVTWFAVVLRKAVEYAEILKVDEDIKQSWKDITENIYLENDGKIYHAHKNAGRAGGWMSVLLYPSETTPFIDMNMYANTRNGQSFIDEYYHSGYTQPWVYFWQASSDLRVGNLIENADSLIDQGLRYTYGTGLLAEITPDSTGLVGMPPYQTAHASYLTAITEQLLFGSIWNNNIYIFTNLPSDLREQKVSFKRLRTSNGVLASGKYSPNDLNISLSGNGEYEIFLPIPISKSENYNVYVNGMNMTGEIKKQSSDLFSMKLILKNDVETVIEVK